MFGRYSETKNRDIFLSGALDKRKAKIGDYFELQEQWTRERRDNPVKDAMAGFWDKLKSGEITMAEGEKLEAMRKIYEDFGAWATMKGYDAYYVKNDRYWVVLNRTKLIMRDADIKPAAQVPYFIKDNAGTKFRQQLTPQEVAAKRHAARTAEQKQAIQDAWDEHNRNPLVIAAKRHANRAPEYREEIMQKLEDRFLTHSLTSLPVFKSTAKTASIADETTTLLENLKIVYGSSSPRYSQLCRVETSIAKFGVMSSGHRGVMRGWLQSDKLVGAYDNIVKNGLDLTGVASMPKEWKERAKALLSEISAEQSAGKGLYEKMPEYAELLNMCRISASSKAKAFGIKKLSTKTPSEVFYEFEDKIPGFSKFTCDKRFFDALPHYVPLQTIGKKGCCYTPSDRRVFICLDKDSTLERLKSDYYKKSIFYHEFSHAASDLEGWASDSTVDKLYSKIKKKINDNSTTLLDDVAKKRTELQRDSKYSYGHDEYEQLGKLADTLQAAMKGHARIKPMGHDPSYFSIKSMQIDETIAHASECFWIGNPVFEKIAPDIYRQLRYLCSRKYGFFP